MNKVNGVLKVLLGFLIISGTVYAQNQQTGKNTFIFDSMEYDYGDVSEDGGLATHTFKILNTGNSPLVIKQVTATCGCTTPEWTKSAIGSQLSGEIKVSYNPKGRPGPFTKSITVYCENADPVQLTIKGVVKNIEVAKKKLPVLTFKNPTHDFGSIGENDGFAEHTFSFVNTGDAPLVISTITASCGCTRPEWSKEPIEPGKEGFIIIAFNPQGRVGNFNKTATVYTNEDDGYKRHKLTILGVVVDKPVENPNIVYVDTTGGVGIENNKLIFDNVKYSGSNKRISYIKNYNSEAAYFSWENVPDYITVVCPDSLKADWPGQFDVYIDDSKIADKRGHYTDNLSLTIKNRDGKILGSENIAVTANYLDDFNKLSPVKIVNSPSLDIENTMIHFGDLKRGNANKQLVLKNKGKNDLILYSVTSDDTRVHFPDLTGKTLAQGETLTVNLTIKTKELGSGNINTDIHVVSNDPKGPVRLIKVTAQKAKK
jgi:Protein of unknown function (DUF1573).